MISGETLRIVSANVQGIQTPFKRKDVLEYLEKRSPNILCLQDTHLKCTEENNVSTITHAECYISGYKTNSRGVTTIFKNNFVYNISKIIRDTEGNCIVTDFETSDISVRLINIYAPNNDPPQFFHSLKNYIEENNQSYLILCGDFNLVLSPSLDSNNYININNPKSRKKLIEIMNIHSLEDSFRYIHPNLRRYTWRRKNPIKQARLDYFIVTNTLLDLVTSSKIFPGYKSDHSILELNIEINKFERGKGIWKLNCDHLKDIEYLTKINTIICQEKVAYALPVYNLQYVQENDEYIQFSIDDKLFLETLLLKIRGETIKYAAQKKNGPTK